MDIKKIFQSDFYKRLLITIGVVVIIIIAFGAGILIGYRKARFSSDWAENYERNFAGPPRTTGSQGFPPMMERGFMDAHGAIGTVLDITSSSLAMNSPDGEKTVLFSSSTLIRWDGQELKPSDLKTNDQILVIGSPNNKGQIEARFIRILPSDQNNQPK